MTGVTPAGPGLRPDGLSRDASQAKPLVPNAEPLSLAERCEKATGPDRELDWRIAEALGVPDRWKPTTAWPPFVTGSKFERAIPDYTASLDAAMTLVPEGWEFTIRRKFAELRHPTRRRCDGTSFSATPALALCAAALRARAA